MNNAQLNSDVKIGIIGANGNVGREIVSLLCKKDKISVWALVRDFDKANKQFSKEVHTKYFDYNEINKIAFKAIDKLLLVQPSKQPINKEWFSIAKYNGVKHIVFISSIEPDVFELRETEIAIEQSGIPYTILRPNTFMQNFNIYDKEDILNKQVIHYPAGAGRISFIDVRDIAEASTQVLLCDQHFNKTYTLTGSVALNFKEACGLLSLEYGHPISYIDTSINTGLEKVSNDPICDNYFLGVRENTYSIVTTDLLNVNTFNTMFI